MSDVVLESAVRQLELLNSGEISVTELAEAHIRQIERLNPVLNAFADFDAERVRERARKHDAWRGSRDRRPLFGLPVTVKSGEKEVTPERSICRGRKSEARRRTKADSSTHHPRTEKRSGPLSLRMTASVLDDSFCFL